MTNNEALKEGGQMSREKEGFRANMELLNRRFPDKDMLTRVEAAEFMGVSVDTVRRRVQFPRKLRLISKADFARQISV